MLLGMSQAVAQDYIPFVREGVKWVYTYRNGHGHSFNLEMKGDVTIDGKQYKAMHLYSGDAIDWENDTIPVYLREEDRIVYGIVPDGKTYDECPVGIEKNDEMNSLIAAGEEFVLYDFKDTESFIKGFIWPEYMAIVIPDVVSVDGIPARRFIFHHGSFNYCLVEGIGFDGILAGYPLSIMTDESMIYLNHVIENGKIIYSAETNRIMPDQSSLPIPREGVQWVNEHVTIDKGDTTRYYYTYEFNGVDARNNAVCYRYTGDKLDLATATMVAKYQNFGYSDTHSNGSIYDNVPYEQVLAEGRDMMYFLAGMQGYYRMYSFPGSDSDITYDYNFYIYRQKEQFLTHENYNEVEPLEIEGIMCRRYAYTDEQGQPLAYVVEGIGFDSRDMGDMLTPFTRKPDPDADYQEYWGLSHVIKDGEIIYKGLRYRDTANAGEEDYQPTIADVTALIDMLLQGNQPGQMLTSRHDINGNGQLTIADVTALIDMLLRK